MIKKILSISTGIICYTSGVVIAEDFFVADFENNGDFSSTGSWTMAQPLFQNNYGKDDLFEVVTGTAHSGDYSLRFSYDGKNGYCNTCGMTTVIHKTGLDNVNYFVADTGEDLKETANAAEGKYLYNLTDGVSRWRIKSVESSGTNLNDKLILDLDRKGIKGKGEDIFNGGDTIQIARRCNVDGNFGGSIDRRDDCDRAISYFDGVIGSQSPGESIFRRAYYRFDTIDPAGNTKLRYWKVFDSTKKGTVYLNHGTTNSTLPNGYPIVGLQELIPEGDPQVIVTPASISNKTVFYPKFGMPDNTSIDRTTWYYIEEEFKASNPPGSATGEYRLWFSKSGEEPNQNAPFLEVTNFNLPVVSSTSLWGNFQHRSHTRGHVYIDDVSISNSWHGPVTANPVNIVPSLPPEEQ